LGLGKRKQKKVGEICALRSFISLYCSQNIVKVITSRGVRLVGHVCARGYEKHVNQCLLGNLKGKSHLGTCTGFSWLKIGSSGGLLWTW
jgi:hypothetical protein